jgi:hypothetical protein
VAVLGQRYDPAGEGLDVYEVYGADVLSHACLAGLSGGRGWGGGGGSVYLLGKCVRACMGGGWVGDWGGWRDMCDLHVCLPCHCNGELSKLEGPTACWMAHHPPLALTPFHHLGIRPPTKVVFCC